MHAAQHLADQDLFDQATAQLERRWSEAPSGVAAAILLADGSVLTGVALDNMNAAMNLCAETGPLCEAFTRDARVVASICVSRESGRPGYTVLAPCGACQERLALWGSDVQVGVDDPAAAVGWSSRPLGELNPYYWATAFAAGDGWPPPAEHSA